MWKTSRLATQYALEHNFEGLREALKASEFVASNAHPQLAPVAAEIVYEAITSGVKIGFETGVTLTGAVFGGFYGAFIKA